MPSILGANSVTGDLITNSLSFNDGDNAYLARTPSSSGSRTKATVSFWVKRGVMQDNGNHFLLEASSSTSPFNMTRVRFGDDLLIIDNTLNGNAANGFYYQSVREYRDPAAWYHIFFSVDVTQANATDGWKLYVNGMQQTKALSYWSQNANLEWSQSGVEMNIGRRHDNTTNNFDGYLAEYHYIDGTIKAYTDFGEVNDNGVWVPKEYTGGSYGTNGFHLKFNETGTSQNASGMGADTSGNDNHFASNNLAATDVGIDTPQNNYCTINSVYADDGNNMVMADFSEGNRKQLTTVDGWKFGRGTFLLEAGKWYVEVKATETGAGENGRFGLQPSQGGEALGNTDDNDTFEGINVGLDSSNTNLQKLDTGSGSTIFSNFTSGSTAMIAYDLDNDKVWIGSNGTWYNNNNASTTLDASNHDIALPTVDLGWVFGLGMTRNGSNNITFEYNWGNPAHAISSGNSDADGHGNFEYPVPSGFFAVNSKNLAEYG
jgi:hypothetical protein|tara:strand:- start:1128 stop:2591 length:1464 start_codon:yes stop_codon:yes gene_type:complete